MHRILLVEDSRDDADLFGFALDDAGLDYVLRVVRSERELREALASFAPSVVVSDFSLPGYSGLEALELVRRERPRWPRVLLSGDASSLPPGCDAVVLDKGELSRLPALVAALAAPSAR